MPGMTGAKILYKDGNKWLVCTSVYKCHQIPTNIRNLQESMASSKEQNKAPRDWRTYVDHYVGLNHDEIHQLEIFLGFLRQGLSVQHLGLFSQISSEKLLFAKDRLD